MTSVLVWYAQAHGRTGGTAQEWVRNMLGCVGRGGNAQAIRDEILHIMHRHHIGEKRGTWMEVPSWTALTASFVLRWISCLCSVPNGGETSQQQHS